jgi:hypothetical protein
MFFSGKSKTAKTVSFSATEEKTESLIADVPSLHRLYDGWSQLHMRELVEAETVLQTLSPTDSAYGEQCEKLLGLAKNILDFIPDEYNAFWEERIARYQSLLEQVVTPVVPKC